jgi:ADP-glyceromanno-heptose 6-epimerase precursor (EC 5.1.3.20)
MIAMIIVTGGAGFIGSHFVKTLQEGTHEPIVVCDVFGKDEKWQNLKRVLLHDLISPDELYDFLDAYQGDISGIIHMGAISSTTEQDVDLIVDHNFKLSKDLFTWCAEQKVRFIYASSAATYGDGRNGFVDGDNPEHLQNFTPLNAYAWSKHAFDRYVAAQKQRGAPLPPQCVGLKFFNVYGPNEYHKGSQLSVVWQLFQQLKQGDTSVKLFKSNCDQYEDGGQCRDFIYVKDCSKVLHWFWEHPKVSGLFNVGTGTARSFKDLAEAVFKALALPPQIDYIEMPKGLAQKYQNFTQADLTNLRHAGYDHPFTSLEAGVKDYIETYLKQDDPYL